MSSDSMKLLKNQAEYWRCALRYGLRQKADVIRWADAIITSNDAPPLAILDLSLMGRANVLDIVSKLREVAGEANERAVRRLVLKHILGQISAGESSAKHATKRLYTMAIAEKSLWQSHYYDIVQMDDAFDLAAAGYVGTMAEAEANFMAFLQQAVRSERDAGPAGC